MTDHNVTRLIQQLIDEIAALDTVTGTLTDVLATHGDAEGGNTHADQQTLPAPEIGQILATIQQKIENRKNSGSTGSHVVPVEIKMM